MTTATAKSNGKAKTETTPVPQADALAAAIAYEAQIATDAAEIRKDSGVLTVAMLDELRPLLTKPIPVYYIGHTARHSQSYKGRDGKETKWPPHDITGISGAQVQATRMSNVLGRQHWRKLARYSDAGKLVQVWIIVGNGLAKARIDESGQLDPNGAEILIVEDGWGAYNKGPDPANHYKGAETSAIKRVFARIGPGEEVYRQEVDLELRPEDQEAPLSAAETPPPVERIDADQAAHLRDLFDKSGMEAKKLQTKLGALGVANVRSVNTGLASLTPGQAAELEEWLGGAQ